MRKPKVCGNCKWFRRHVGDEIKSDKGVCVLNPAWVAKIDNTPQCSHWKRGE